MKGTFRELSHYLGNGNTMLFREDRFEKNTVSHQTAYKKLQKKMQLQNI